MKITPAMSDFTLRNEGSIYMLSPQTPEGEAWAADRLPPDAPTFGAKHYVIEHRFIGDIVLGILNDELTIIGEE